MSKILTLCMICKFHIVVLVMDVGQKIYFYPLFGRRDLNFHLDLKKEM